jgi:hypothetical protein
MRVTPRQVLLVARGHTSTNLPGQTPAATASDLGSLLLSPCTAAGYCREGSESPSARLSSCLLLCDLQLAGAAGGSVVRGLSGLDSWLAVLTSVMSLPSNSSLISWLAVFTCVVSLCFMCTAVGWCGWWQRCAGAVRP